MCVVSQGYKHRENELCFYRLACSRGSNLDYLHKTFHGRIVLCKIFDISLDESEIYSFFFFLISNRTEGDGLYDAILLMECT